MAKPFSFNVAEAMKSGVYASGTTGAGKSDILMYCADALREAGVTVFILDPSQDWMNRFPIRYVVNFNVRDSKAAINNDLSSIQLRDAIFDISNLTTMQIQEVADQFCWMLFYHQTMLPQQARKPFFIIFEEAQIVLPQGVMKAKRLQNIVRLFTVGRNFGIRVGVITQFASMVDKDAMKYCKQRYLGWTDEMNDVHYIRNFIGEEKAESLKFFHSGEFMYSFPTENILDKIKIEPYKRIASKDRSTIEWNFSLPSYV